MQPSDSNPPVQNPVPSSQPLPHEALSHSEPAAEPSLEEMAAQITAANSSQANTPPAPASAEPILTTAAEIPSSAPRQNSNSTTAPDAVSSVKDAITQLDSLPVTTPDSNQSGRKIAKVLADNEVIGESQIKAVADVLTPELLQQILGQANISATVPISITNADGTNQLVHVPVKAVYDFFSGRTDQVNASK